jgi:signal transduction histidine kinase
MTNQAVQETRPTHSEEREHFLAEASRVLGSSIDFETTIQKVARLAVPTLADWCGVDLVTDTGELQRIAVAHVDPAKVESANKMHRLYPPQPDALTGVPAVVRTGKSEFYPDISEEMVTASAMDARHLELLRELDLHSVLIAPLRAAEQTFGALTFISTRSSRRYTEADLALAEELAHRAALAIQSARMYAAEQEARKRAEEMVERTERLQVITATLSQATTPFDVGQAALGGTIAVLHASSAALFLVAPDGKTLELIEATGPDKDAVLDFRTLPLHADSPMAAAVREGHPMYIGSGRPSDDRDPLLEGLNRKGVTWGCAITPLKMGDRILGAMVWTFREPREFTHRDRVFIETVARQCALAVERAQLYAAERSAREAAQAANRAKSDFLATMSHELRTPINAIQGYAQLLDLGIPGPLKEQQREYLSRISLSAGHLLGLVNEVLDLAKIESGTIKVDTEPVVAGDTVDGALSLIRPQAASRQIALSEECGGARGATYLGDEHRVRQILTNLLSNAVKFTPPGGAIVVECSTTTEPPKFSAVRRNCFVVFRISDTGIGIAPDQIERIFEPFTQADGTHKNPYTRGTTGTGLGLTISRRLARLMGGELTVESTPGRGSVFSLWMPMPEDGPVTENGYAGEAAVSETESREPDAVVETAAAAPIAGLANISRGLLKASPSILAGFVRNVRAAAQIPAADAASDSQIEDHMAAFLADLSTGLRLLEVAGSDPSELLRDSSAIIRTIMEQHGNQRFRIGWSEEGINAEMKILLDVTCEAVSRVPGASTEEVSQASAAIEQFIGQATRHTLAAYRLAASALQLGTMRQ